MTRRVLVTGASGFVGRHAPAALLARRFEVHGTARRPPPAEVSSDVAWHRADLLDPAQRSTVLERVRPTHLLHLAWDVETGRFWTAPENELWRAASLDLVERFIAAGGRRAVLVGSCAEYDWSRQGIALWKESDRLGPTTAYGRAKLALAEAAAERVADAGASFAWGRIFLMFGLAEDPRRLVPSVARAVLAGREARCSSGHQIRDFTDTRDIAGALAALLDAEEVTGTVNIGSGRATRVAELAGLIGRLAGHPELVHLGALPDRAGEPASLVADLGRLRDEVGFVPARSFEERVAECVDWWRGEARR